MPSVREWLSGKTTREVASRGRPFHECDGRGRSSEAALGLGRSRVAFERPLVVVWNDMGGHATRRSIGSDSLQYREPRHCPHPAGHPSRSTVWRAMRKSGVGTQRTNGSKPRPKGPFQADLPIQYGWRRLQCQTAQAAGRTDLHRSQIDRSKYNTGCMKGRAGDKAQAIEGRPGNCAVACIFCRIGPPDLSARAREHD